MERPPIPERFPPLQWRKPAFLWTPLALALAVGWPGAVFYNDPGPQRIVLVAGALVFAIALITLGGAYALRRPPRARRNVILHVVFAGALAALTAPFVLTNLLALVANYERDGAGAAFTPEMSLAMAPLAFVVGLPIALVSGVMFAWAAFARRAPGGGDILGDDIFSHDVQPFR